MMKSTIEGTSLDNSTKTFTNHSTRKTVVKKLKTAGLERSSIVKVTGHRNEKSLDDFDESDEIEQRQLSRAISSGTYNLSQLESWNHAVNSSSNASPFSNPFSAFAAQYGDGFIPYGSSFASSPQFAFPPNIQMPISGQNDQRQSLMNLNSFNNCQVTFNMGNGNPPTTEIKAAEKRAHSGSD